MQERVLNNEDDEAPKTGCAQAKSSSATALMALFFTVAFGWRRKRVDEMGYDETMR